MGDKVRIGIVGLGNWARSVHVPNLLSVKGATVSAVCSRSQANIDAALRALPERPATFHEAQELFRSDACDAVIIATPNDLHPAQAVAALDAGKHVFCEKPLALTRDDALAVERKARVSKQVFMVGLELRYADVPRALRECVQKGMIGRPRYVATQILRNWRVGTSPGWRSDPARSGGVFFELGCHYTDLYEYLLGEPTQSIFASGGRRIPDGMTDYASVTASYPSGAIGCLNLCLFASGATDRVDLELVGDDGRIQAEALSGTIRCWTEGTKQPATVPVNRPPDYQYIGFPGSCEILQDFVDCIRTGRQPVADIEAAVSSTLTAIAGETSLREHRPVRL